jgi:hypothetical protein
MIITDLRPMSSAPLDGTPVRLFVCAGLRSPPFGVWNAPNKPSEMGTIVGAGFCSMTTREPLIPAGIRRETVVVTAEPVLP